MRERRALEVARDAVLVEPVAGLVHRPEEAVEVVLEVAGRQPDVADRDRRRERVDGRVEPPLGRVEPEPLDHLQLELLLALDRERRAADRTLAVLAGGGDERHLLLLQPVEDGADLGGLHPGLEVVEEDVVGLVVVVEALDVAAAQLEVRAQGGQELREVGLLPRLHPDRHRERRGAGHLGAQLRGNAPRLLPLAADEPDQARLVRVVLERVLVRRELVEEPADLVGRERLVREPLERRQLLRPNTRSAGRHLHLLIPAEQRRRAVEIVDLADALLQACEGCLHRLRNLPFRVRRRRIVAFEENECGVTHERQWRSLDRAGPCSSVVEFRPRSASAPEHGTRRGRSSSELPLRPACPYFGAQSEPESPSGDPGSRQDP